jgi:hypothetical protein
MDDPSEHTLVVKALTCGLSNCVEWINDRTANRIRNDPDLRGLTPEGIKHKLTAFVKDGGKVKQKREGRPGYKKSYAFYYKANLPLEGFSRRLFVEMVLTDGDDPDFPVVALVNAHF